MIAFLDAHREVYGVEPICRLLPIAPSTYYERAAHRADPARLPARAQRDVRLRAEIRRVWEANFRVYGVRKVWRELRREGIAIARCTTARLMKQMGIYGAIRGKTVKTTISNKAAPCPRDKVNRQFQAPRPNALWLSDFTYVATWQGFVSAASSSTSLPGGSSAGGRRDRPKPASFSMLSNRHSMTGVRFRGRDWCTIATAAASTSRSAILNAWPQQASSPP